MKKRMARRNKSYRGFEERRFEEDGLLRPRG